MDDDRDLRATFLPPEQRDSASRHGALKGLRKHKPAENLLRMLSPHVGCGHSLRETAVRAKKAGPGDFPAVSLMKRLKKSGDRLQALCAALFRERGLALAADGGFQVRAFDATTVKEPDKTGSLRRIRYSVSLPSLTCGFFRITAAAGPDTGESFLRFPIRGGGHILADRGYSTGNGIRHVVGEGDASPCG